MAALRRTALWFTTVEQSCQREECLGPMTEATATQEVCADCGLNVWNGLPLPLHSYRARYLCANDLSILDYDYYLSIQHSPEAWKVPHID